MDGDANSVGCVSPHAPKAAAHPSASVGSVTDLVHHTSAGEEAKQSHDTHRDVADGCADGTRLLLPRDSASTVVVLRVDAHAAGQEGVLSAGADGVVVVRLVHPEGQWTPLSRVLMLRRACVSLVPSDALCRGVLATLASRAGGAVHHTLMDAGDTSHGWLWRPDQQMPTKSLQALHAVLRQVVESPAVLQPLPVRQVVSLFATSHACVRRSSHHNPPAGMLGIDGACLWLCVCLCVFVWLAEWCSRPAARFLRVCRLWCARVGDRVVPISRGRALRPPGSPPPR